jgi:putative ABC transport system substrate-binding protein
MRRREFISGIGAAAAWPLAAQAQREPMPVVGFLGSGSAGTSAVYTAAFRSGLGEVGYVEGQGVSVEYRWPDGDYNRLPALAADLVGREANVIVTGGGTPAAHAAQAATSTIPIVFVGVTDPVKAGFVTNLARPDGNLTGFSDISNELTAKRLELISELVPGITNVAFLVNPNNSALEPLIELVEAAARAKSVQLAILKASTNEEIDAAFTVFRQHLADALVVASDPFFGSRREQLIALASNHAMPAIYSVREYVTAGGLMSYGTSIPALYRELGIYCGRILNGEKPADLPIQQPTKFELVINKKVAKTLGLTVPPTLMARAPEIIE